jgi:phosphomannomutase
MLFKLKEYNHKWRLGEMPKEIDPSIFKAYDIRGIYPQQLNEEIARKVGKGLGSYLGKGKRIVVGMDVRKSSPSLAKSFLKGLRDTGINVTFIGVTSTPMHLFAISHFKYEGGATVSASHNPPEWNGFKMYGAEAPQPISAGFGMERLSSIITNKKFATGTGMGTYEEKEVLQDYEKFMLSNVDIKEGLSIGLDPGNGAYAGVASGIFKKTSVEATAINDVQDGSFPSRSPEPKPATITGLIDLVKKERFNFGVAYDGDGDRGIFVDNNGVPIPSDIMLSLLIKSFLKKGQKAVYEVSCSDAVEETIRSVGGTPIMTRVGRAFIINEMKRGAVFGGELSGHLYFKQIYSGDDALFASLKLAELLSKSSKPLSEMIGSIPMYERHVEEIKVEERAKFKAIDLLKKSLSKNGKLVVLDGVKLRTENGWFLLRASNTGPAIRLIAESKSRNGLETLLSLAREKFNDSYNEALASSK